MSIKTVLTIAGSDSGGGAGIQADLKAISSLGCFGCSAITAITAQNTLGVHDVAAVEPSLITAQITSVLDDIGAQAIKIGMLPTDEAIAAVAECLKQYPDIPVVHDPVMVATSGDVLMPQQVVTQLRDQLLASATIITPNYAEACLLAEIDVSSSPTVEALINTLSRTIDAAILITGGDASDTGIKNQQLNQECAIDYLYDHEKLDALSTPKIITKNTHGTGCSLSSAIASYLALGQDLKEAVVNAKQYITHAIAAAASHQIGSGHGPIAHFYQHT